MSKTKIKTKKLALARATMKHLAPSQLAEVNGGLITDTFSFLCESMYISCAGTIVGSNCG
jgi:hypothetical protein